MSYIAFGHLWNQWTLIARNGSILRNRIGIARNGAGGLDTATISVVRRETPQSMALFNKEDSDIVN
jgi:hypothetical protein